MNEIRLSAVRSFARRGYYLIRHDEQILAEASVLAGLDGVAAAEHLREHSANHLIARYLARCRVNVDIG